MSAANARDIAQRAKEAARSLAALSESQRNTALLGMARAVAEAREALMAANHKDLHRAESLTAAEALSPATMSRLRLSEAKLREMVEGIESVSALPDPLGRVLRAVELDDRDPGDVRNAAPRGLHLRRVSVPLGVLLVIFEARPDAVTQIASLALKSGNAVILKAGSEVEETAEALVRVIRSALTDGGVSPDAVSLVTGREAVLDLLAQHGVIDMVIPRGSNRLVEFVKANTRIPVLGHSEGVCHVFVDRAADELMSLRVIADAKLDYPAACNAVETVLVHAAIADSFVPRLAQELQQRGVQLHGDQQVIQLLQGKAAAVSDWHTEYGCEAISLRVVSSLEEAMEHIHRFGSRHTECILTEDHEVAERFLREVDAAGVYHNASTRFADGYRYGFGAEVGISTSKLHARGPVGLEGLTTYKYVLRGQGHVAADYRGEGARSFTHRTLRAADAE